MNLLAHRVADIIFDEGAHYLVPEEEGGRQRVETRLEALLRRSEVDPDAVTIDDFRRISQEEVWNDFLEGVIPPDTRDRVDSRFDRLVFR